MTTVIIQAVKHTLSIARMSTYEQAVKVGNNEITSLELYAWNAQTSSAFLTPLHICEVVIRNVVSEVLEAKYGDKWAFSASFQRSLPKFEQQELEKTITRLKVREIGRLIPELKFFFWQSMLTKRHDNRLWNHYLIQAFPNLDDTQTIKEHRKNIYNELDNIRRFRNRIAHHEPIFTRNLTDDFNRIVKLVNYRCKNTCTWMVDNQSVLESIHKDPRLCDKNKRR